MDIGFQTVRTSSFFGVSAATLLVACSDAALLEQSYPPAGPNIARYVASDAAASLNATGQFRLPLRRI
jgi:hypothetical protein